MTAYRAQRYPIVIALDDSEYAEIVLEHALDLAGRHADPALHFVRVVKRQSDLEAEQQRLTDEVIEGLQTFSLQDGKCLSRVHVRAGDPVDEITNLTYEVRAKLLVIGRYGKHHRFRSTAERVIDTVQCPTLVVGLSGDTVDTQEQCPKCVELRETTDGERWFCSAHAAPDRMRLSSLVPGTTSSTRGGVW